MLNQVILVGKIASEPEIVSDELGHMNVTFSLLIGGLNDDQVEEVYIPITLIDNLSLNSNEYISLEMTLGVKGHLVMNGNTLQLIADKITFISNRKDNGLE